MMISTKGRYALRVMIDLAQNSKEGFVSLKDVAKWSKAKEERQEATD